MERSRLPILELLIPLLLAIFSIILSSYQIIDTSSIGISAFGILAGVIVVGLMPAILTWLSPYNEINLVECQLSEIKDSLESALK